MGPIFTAHLFPMLDQKLIALLKSLTKSDWEKQTIASHWKVKDVAAHLLDGNLRTLSIARDTYNGVPPDTIRSYQDLVSYLNQLNADWIKAAKRLSPTVLIELLESTGKQYTEYLQNLALYDTAVFPVAWAGEERSRNWFHVAREYTEKWHHQQQIRLAVGQEAELLTKEFYLPYLETSMRALPHHYRSVDANVGETVKFSVTGAGGGTWFLRAMPQGWKLIPEAEVNPVSKVEIDGNIAWRLFTKGISPAEAAQQVKISGNRVVGEKILNMVAVMA